MEFELLVAASGLLGGLVVGLTGMGGGALLTPILVLGLGVPPLTAVSSDVLASVGMKFVGAGVHLKGGTVHRGVVKWLALGSIPASIIGAYLLRRVDQAGLAEHWLMPILGVALLVAAAAMALRAAIRGRRTSAPTLPAARPLPTLAVGVVGGLVVGMTSVGSGSVMLVLLVLLYPTLTTSRLVGTDLTQALPLVLAAAFGHVIFGQVDWALTACILAGGVPGIYIGARVSSRAPDWLIRPVLLLILSTLGLKLLGASADVLTLWSAIGIVVAVGHFLGKRRGLVLLERASKPAPQPPTI